MPECGTAILRQLQIQCDCSNFNMDFLVFFVTRKDTAVVIRLGHREFISFHTSLPSGFACDATATGDETEIDVASEARNNLVCDFGEYHCSLFFFSFSFFSYLSKLVSSI